MIIDGVDEHGVTNTLWDDLQELEGKALGCWCDPGLCHGQVLKERLELTERPSPTMTVWSGPPALQIAMASVKEDDMLLSALAELAVAMPGPGKDVTARSLSEVWKYLAPTETVLSFFGKGRSARWDNPGGEDDHAPSQLNSSSSRYPWKFGTFQNPRRLIRESTGPFGVTPQKRQSCYVKRRQWETPTSIGYCV